jgi:type I restriction enzyme R subunit
VSARPGGPDWANNRAKRALVDLDYDLAIAIDTVVRQSKPDAWVGNPMKERKVEQDVVDDLLGARAGATN